MNIRSYLLTLRDAGLALVYPRGCTICGAMVESFDNGATCAACWQKTAIFKGDETICDKCGRLFENQAAAIAAKTFCHRCDDDLYDFARAVGVYENALRTAILDLKEKPEVAAKLRELLQQIVSRPPLFAADVIIPVPLHAKRLRERGFNQAFVLAQIIGSTLKVPILKDCLVREVHTPMHRAGMDERARRESIEKAFTVKQHAAIQNQNVLLVDDVFTSGATVSLAADALKKAGAGKVFVITLARTL